MKRTTKWIGLFLCVVLVLGIFAKPALTTYASELTNSVIKEKEQEIDKAKQEKKQLQNSLGARGSYEYLWQAQNRLYFS